MDVKQQTDRVEQELLAVITKHLERNEIDTLTAQRLTKDFLAILPMQNQADLLAKLKTLSETYEEAKEVYTLEFSQDIKEREEQALNQMRTAIQQGNIEHAINVAKALRENN